MTLSAFKQALDQLAQLDFMQPNRAFVPRHFHVTKFGLITKHFIDCGGTRRSDHQIYRITRPHVVHRAAAVARS